MSRAVLNVDAAKWRAPDKIKAFTTRRAGGVSESPYESFNLGAHVGDSESRVRQNRQQLRADGGLPSNPIWLNQVHGINLSKLESSTSSRPVISADGAYTQTPNVVCAVMTADCLPLFLTNTQGDRVALLHAGWRGMAAGIIEAGVRALQTEPNEVIAWAGPCIGPDAFAVGKEVPRQLGGSSQAYRQANTDDKLLANLYMLAGERLAEVGVHDYTHSSACTFTEQDRYFSYRRDGACGRMASVIWIDR